MMYFIPWVLLFLLVIIAVPVAAMMDKRKARGAMGDEPMGAFGEIDEEEVGDFGEEVVPAEGEEGEAVFEEAEGVADDEFSAFD